MSAQSINTDWILNEDSGPLCLLLLFSLNNMWLRATIHTIAIQRFGKKTYQWHCNFLWKHWELWHALSSLPHDEIHQLFHRHTLCLLWTLGNVQSWYSWWVSPQKTLDLHWTEHCLSVWCYIKLDANKPSPCAECRLKLSLWHLWGTYSFMPV